MLYEVITLAAWIEGGIGACQIMVGGQRGNDVQLIETPRGALVADSIGKQAEFFSFGTNDLTQMTLGFSRDDVGKSYNFV